MGGRHVTVLDVVIRTIAPGGRCGCGPEQGAKVGDASEGNVM
jgi:hypothetical protein